MPVVGTRQDKTMGVSYQKDPLYKYAKAFAETAKNILTESGTDLFLSPTVAMINESASGTLRDFFVENAIDRGAYEADEYNDQVSMLEELYLNEKEAITEYSGLAAQNPVIGLSIPMYKNLLMNCIFDKGAIPKAVATTPKFTLTMETRLLIKPDGTEIDMYKNQMDMTDAIDSAAPEKIIELKLPEIGATDMLEKIGASKLDNLSIETRVVAVKVEVNATKGQILPDGTKVESPGKVDAWIPVELRFTPGYGSFERSFVEPVVINIPGLIKPEGVDGDVVTERMSGTMEKNRLTIQALKGIVKGVRVAARKDTSNGMAQACSVDWRQKTDLIEIPSYPPINTTISPEEVKDIAALYNVNQLTKIMSMMNLALQNYKDDKIMRNLDTSYEHMPAENKAFGIFDFAPRDGYMSDHVEWRHKTFFDALDTHVTELLQVLNDPNMTITIIGRPDIIRKITPTEYMYQSPSSIGPVELEYTRTVVTSDRRVYNFISSQKIKNGFKSDARKDELTIILCPRNSQRIIYRIYDYQMYLSNEIRNPMNPSLPAVHAFERWKFVEYQPVQGRIKILNPTGLKGNNQPLMGLDQRGNVN